MIKKKIIKFIYIGILNTLVYYMLYSLFLYIGINYVLAVILATTIGVFFNFKTFGTYVFNNKDNSLIFNFIIVYLLLFIINIMFINLFNIFIDNYYLSGFLAIFPYSIISYYLNDKFVFSKKDNP